MEMVRRRDHEKRKDGAFLVDEEIWPKSISI